MNVLDLIVQALWFILPAYFANATPVLISKAFRGKFPIDFGKKMKDGEPVFGPGKTWPGFIIAVMIGTLVGFLQHRFAAGFLLSLGALLGDLIKSFFKRRLKIARGKSWPVADQLDFVIGALLLASIVEVPSWEIIVLVFILTPPIHLLGNVLNYFFKLKKEWY
jgi:CDP-2,3-bis-(O-geranylgeranyl)-sn-glycerol synthase